MLNISTLTRILDLGVTLEASITTSADDTFCDTFSNFLKIMVFHENRPQTIVMKYHALFVIYEKKQQQNLKL